MKVLITVRFSRFTMPAAPDDIIGKLPHSLCISKDFDDVEEAGAFMARVNVAVSEALREIAASSNS
jgi:hypothetical protein